MKKQLFAGLIVAIIIVCTTTAVLAANETTGSMTVSYTVEPTDSYTVSIPATVNINDIADTLNQHIEAVKKICIRPSYQIGVDEEIHHHGLQHAEVHVVDDVAEIGVIGVRGVLDGLSDHRALAGEAPLAELVSPVHEGPQVLFRVLLQVVQCLPNFFTESKIAIINFLLFILLSLFQIRSFSPFPR